MAKVRQALSDTVFDDYSDTRVTTMGHITEVVTMQKRCVGPPVVRVDKDHFMDLRTGELLEYEHMLLLQDSDMVQQYDVASCNTYFFEKYISSRRNKQFPRN